MNLKCLHLIPILLLITSMSAQAQIIFSLNPAGQTGAPGTIKTFNGTLANTGALTVFLNGDSFTGLSPALTLDDNPFFNNFPLFLSPGNIFTADIFTVSIANNAATGNYLGTFRVTGGADPIAQNVLAIQNFQVKVVPEPGMLSMLSVTGFISVGLFLFRRKRVKICQQ